MATKSPSQARRDLEAAQEKIKHLIGVLRQNSYEKKWQLGDTCSKTAHRLEKLLADSEIPETYKVAVVGRFKAGKSSFVNELLGIRLAGEDTNPETAAITTFSHGENVRAEIKMIPLEEWNEQESLFESNEKDPDAQRIANWWKFGEATKGSASSSALEIHDLAALKEEYIVSGGRELAIEMNEFTTAESQRKAAADFRQRIKQYTTSTKPLHCLVQSITIFAPSALLQEGVTLIDTPGLDDTERFRVDLTEKAVNDVDAVLFLTKSGGSYGQAEKSFLLSMLRRGSVRQLVFIVTQVDQTYQQHVNQSRDEDISASPILERIASERKRIRTEILATLDELTGDSDSSSSLRYTEQLNQIGICFTSAENHRVKTRGELVAHPIKGDDPGGILDATRRLFSLLSTGSRLAASKERLKEGTSAALRDAVEAIDKRRATIKNLKNREVAEERLATFREQFEADVKYFLEASKADLEVLKNGLADRRPIESVSVEKVALLAEITLGEFETQDAGRHWKTRRSGYWGYMTGLQKRVANRIFPDISLLLGAQTELFGDYVEKFEVQIEFLARAADDRIQKLDIGSEISIDFKSSIVEFVRRNKLNLDEIVQAEEQIVINLLESFVDENVQDKISEARADVADVWGRGTTNIQTGSVREFYGRVKLILKQALKLYLQQRLENFSCELLSLGENLPVKARSDLNNRIDQASGDIKAAAAASIAGQKEDFMQTAAELSAEIASVEIELAQLFGHGAAESDGSNLSIQADYLDDEVEGPAVSHLGNSEAKDDGPPVGALYSSEHQLDKLLQGASVLRDRYFLNNGEKGWPFSKIFESQYLVGATEVWLTDPFLAAPHQRRNFLEWASWVGEVAKPKTMHVISRVISDLGEERDRGYFEELENDFVERFGMCLKYSLDSEVHDRTVVFDTGIVFKLGRGLDIWKPVTGLGVRDQTLRQVRRCEIEVLST